MGDRRVLTSAVVMITASLLSGCSLLEHDSPVESSPAPTPNEGSGPTGVHVEGDDEEFGDACTTEGDYTVDSSVERSFEEIPEVDGAELRVALGYAASDGPSARLYLSATGPSSAAPEQFDGSVGDAHAIEDWTVTITSICADEVRFDVATEAP
ncbi:hypothetical protein [Brachybacterium sp. GCM10030252]|uniref:hypothetical protein n=1 Tax=Brachybacterium sp. GCM10030252 TaxID=3273380 RepID=UPI00361FBE1C